MKFLELFIGYGGFRLAFERAGWKFEKVYFSEIDKYAIANYRYNYPDAEWLGSVTDIPDIGKVDLITFGWPCQDNSIAGKRKGQTGDTQSGLLFHAINCVERFKPRHFVAENVEGLRTVNKGIDIIESLKVLTFLNDSMPQYDVEMQLLNTRWFLPQNRKRLFFVGHLRNGSGQKVFPVGEDNQRIQEATNKLSRKVCPEDSIANCLTKSMAKMARTDNYIVHNLHKSGAKTGMYEIEERIRRLTPIECERLQGLPDGWTAKGIFEKQILKDVENGIYEIVYREQPISDTQRYKLCGNGVSIPPVQVIAEKLKAIVQTEKQKS